MTKEAKVLLAILVLIAAGLFDVGLLGAIIIVGVLGFFAFHVFRILVDNLGLFIDI